MKKVHKVIKFNQNVWLKPYTDPREKTKNDFEKKLKLMNNALYGKSIENVSLSRDINFVAVERRGKYLTFEPNYHATKSFTENYQQ